jgi:hypothetical protein
MLSFAIPIFLGLPQAITGASPRNRAFKLPGWAGWTTNFITTLWAVKELVFFDFPGAILVSNHSTQNTHPLSSLWHLLGLSIGWLMLAKTTAARELPRNLQNRLLYLILTLCQMIYPVNLEIGSPLIPFLVSSF